MNLFKTFSYLNFFCLCIALQAKIDPQKPLKGFLVGLQQPHALLPSDVNPDLHGETPSQLWSAKHMVEQLGCDSIKIGMSQQNLKRQGITVDKDTTLLEYAQMPLYKEIIDLPYKTIFFWAHGTIKPRYFKERHAEILYKEFYDFTKYLLTQYNNSGKVFMIGNWEGDWLMGGQNTGPTESLIGASALPKPSQQTKNMIINRFLRQTSEFEMATIEGTNSIRKNQIDR